MALSDGEHSTSGLANSAGITDFLFFDNTISKLPKVTKTNFLGGDKSLFLLG